MKKIASLLVLAFVFGSLSGMAAAAGGASSGTYKAGKMTADLEFNVNQFGDAEVTFTYDGESRTTTGTSDEIDTLDESREVRFPGKRFRVNNGKVQWSNGEGESWSDMQKVAETLVSSA